MNRRSFLVPALALLAAPLAQRECVAQAAMQWLAPDDARLQWTNAMAWEARDGGLQPVRVPKARRDTWSQDNEKKRAMSGAGVSARFRSDTNKIVIRATLLGIEPTPAAANPADAWEFNRPPFFSLYRNGKYLSAVAGKIQAGPQEVTILDIQGPRAEAEYQVLLPFYYRNAETILRGVGIEAGASLAPASPDTRPRVLFYGDSITHGHGVTAPHETYVWQACQKADCVPLNFGFGGTGWGDAVVAETIADRGDWDALVIAIGANSFGGIDGASKQMETAARYGEKYGVFLNIIRAKWPVKPIIAMTPILNRADILGIRNPNGETPREYREAIEKAVRARQARDTKLQLVDGLRLVGEQSDIQVTDLVHPNDVGARNMGEGVAQALRAALGR